MRAHPSQVRPFIKALPILLVSLAITGCATVQPDEMQQALQDDTGSSSQVFAQHIQGKLLDIDGKTPVAGATVYIAQNKPALKHHRMLSGISLSSSRTVSQSCVHPEVPYSTYACTRADGSFDLAITDVAKLPLPVIFSKGKHRVSINLDLNDLGSDIGEVAFDLPENLQKKIAIVLDFFNPYEDIKHQLKTGHYDMREAFRTISNQMVHMFDLDKTKSKVLFPTFASLFEDWDGDKQIDLYKYDTIYINSGNSGNIAGLSKDKREALLKFISRGGQLFITEWKFELPEIPPDQYI